MLKDEYINKIRADKQLRTKIMLIADIHQATLYRWLNLNSVNLTTADVMRVICEHFGVKQTEVLEPLKRVTV